MKTAKMGMKKRKIQETWSLYLIVNNVMLFPSVLGFFITDHLPTVWAMIDRLPRIFQDILGIAWLPFMIVDMFYWCFRLHYVHIVLELGFLAFFAFKLFKEKNIKTFLLILFLTAISIGLNLLWSVYGEYPMGV